jgi:hypothetical protein
LSRIESNPDLCYFVHSDRTDVESTHSSNVSGSRAKNGGVVIPPDALYATSSRKPVPQQQQQHFKGSQTLPNNHSFQSHHDFHQKPHLQYSGYDPATGAVFNDCKVRHHHHHHHHTLQFSRVPPPHHLELSQQHNHEMQHFNTLIRRNNY